MQSIDEVQGMIERSWAREWEELCQGRSEEDLMVNLSYYDKKKKCTLKEYYEEKYGDIEDHLEDIVEDEYDFCPDKVEYEDDDEEGGKIWFKAWVDDEGNLYDKDQEDYEPDYDDFY